MRLLLVCAILVTSAMSQRPSYAGTGPIGRPGLASRFKDENAESTTAVPVALNNRVGEVSTQRIPVDARGDEDLVNRLNQWPREHRPYWLLNAEQIEAARNQQPASNTNTNTNNGVNQVANRNTFDDTNTGTITAKPLPQRSPFLPPLDG